MDRDNTVVAPTIVALVTHENVHGEEGIVKFVTSFGVILGGFQFIGVLANWDWEKMLRE